MSNHLLLNKKFLPALAASIIVSLPAGAANDKISPSALGPGMVAASKTSSVPLNNAALHRMDFLVKGKSCAACLLKMQARLTKTPGVAKAAIMLRSPYAGVCIYDSTKTDKDKLLVIAKGDETVISFDKVEDDSIPKVPMILVPHHATDTQ